MATQEQVNRAEQLLEWMGGLLGFMAPAFDRGTIPGRFGGMPTNYPAPYVPPAPTVPPGSPYPVGPYPTNPYTPPSYHPPVSPPPARPTPLPRLPVPSGAPVGRPLIPQPLFGPTLPQTAARDLAWAGTLFRGAAGALMIAARLSIYAAALLALSALLRYLLGRLFPFGRPRIPTGWDTYLDCGRPAEQAIDTIGNCVGVLTRTPFLWFNQSGSFTSGAYRYSAWYKFKGLNALTRYQEFETSIIYRKLLTDWNLLPDGEKFPAPWRPLPYSAPDHWPPGYDGWPTAFPRELPEAVPPTFTDPGTAPPRLPYRDLPRRRLRRRYRLPHFQPGGGYDPDPGPDPSPGEGAGGGPPKPGEAGNPGPVSPPPGGSEGGNDKPDKPSKRERKFKTPKGMARLVVAAAGYLKKAAEAGLEGLDAVEAFYNALPWRLRKLLAERAKREGRKGVPGAWKIQALRDHWDELDWMGHSYTDRKGQTKWSPGVVQNLISNQIEDMAFGMYGQGQQEALQRLFKQTGFRKMSTSGYSGDVAMRTLDYYRRGVEFQSARAYH